VGSRSPAPGPFVSELGPPLTGCAMSISRSQGAPRSRPKPPDEADKLVRLYKQDNPFEVDDNGEEIPEAVSTQWVDSPWFNMFIGLVIAGNAVTIGMETAQKASSEDVSVLWFIIEFAFCFIFLAELSARLYYHGWRYFGRIGNARTMGEVVEFVRPNVGNIFDFIVVVIALIDTFILMPIGLGGDARFLAFLRFMRLVRLIRLIRLFKIFKELWLVASGLLDALRTLFWVFCLLGLFIEVCAIVTSRAIGHNDELYDPYFKTSGGWDHEIYFKTVLRSMFTLFQIMTLDSWSDDIVRHIGKQQPGMVAFFIAFVAVTNFGVLNVIVGVVIEATIRTSHQDKDNFKKTKERQRKLVFDQLKDIFEKADADGNGLLTLEEVVDATRDADVYNKLKMIDFPVDKPEEVFDLLDYDQSGELSIEEFIDGCLRMKGGAKSKDLLVAQVALNTLRDHLEDFEVEVNKFNKKVLRLYDTAKAMLGHGEHIFLNTREYRMRHPEMKEQNIPRMPTKDLEEAPWLRKPSKDQAPVGPRLAAIADGPAQQALTNAVPPSLSNNESAHALDVYQGSQQPSLSSASPERVPVAGTLPDGPDAPPVRPAPPPLPAGMIADQPRAGMLTNSAASDGLNQQLATQIPGAMPDDVNNAR